MIDFRWVQACAKRSVPGSYLNICICLALGTLLLTSCAAILPLNYTPGSRLSASGAVRVSEFGYLPSLQGRVESNQVQNTAWDDLFFDREVGAFFMDAVEKELRFVGIKTDSDSRTLRGEVREFLIDDLGAYVDWTLRVLYRVERPEKALYESEKITRRRTAKFGDPSATMNQTIRLNIDELIKDPAFLKAINNG